MDIIITLIQFFHRHFLRQPRDHYERYGGPGKWAVITGPSNGIGEEFSHQLAKQGFNICLVGRSQERLDKVAKALLTTNSKIKTRVILADANKT